MLMWKFLKMTFNVYFKPWHLLATFCFKNTNGIVGVISSPLPDADQFFVFLQFMSWEIEYYKESSY